MAVNEKTVHKVAKTLVGAFIQSHKAEHVADLYHDVVEALIHPYNADAILSIRNAAGAARFSREKGSLSDDATIKQLILDTEAALAHLGVEPIVPDSDDEFQKTLAGMVEEAAHFLKAHVPAEVFDGVADPDVADPSVPIN